jgi:hypothetical protein
MMDAIRGRKKMTILSIKLFPLLNLQTKTNQTGSNVVRQTIPLQKVAGRAAFW